VLYGVSSAVFARPIDWPPHAQVTGAWRPPPPLHPQPLSKVELAIQEFIQRKPDLVSAASSFSASASTYSATHPMQAGTDCRPVWIGFGTALSAELHPAALQQRLHALIAAVRSTGWRVIVAGLNTPSASELADRDVFVVPSAAGAAAVVRHDWLFPQCALVIHHGGAGTTHSALRSAVPQLISPIAYDQHFYATQIEQLLQVGLKVRWPPPAAALHELSAAAAQSLRQLSKQYPQFARLAKQYAAIVTAEETDSTAAAVHVVLLPF
jgi:UDP:flavonoid glycosyltransferase YjiC (YdhE family)